MTKSEQMLDKLLNMSEKQIERLYNLFERFNWDCEAIQEYLQNGGKV